ncbi:MAG: DUF4349 domain-containing protein [Acetatifactor sp.]
MGRKRGNGFRALMVGVLMAMLLAGCGTSKSDSTAFMEIAETSGETYSNFAAGVGSYYGKDAGESPEEAVSDGTEGAEAAVYADNRKLIKTVDMSVETKEFDTLMETLEARVQELGGYIENLDTYNGSVYSGYRSSRNASMTLRIPQDRLEEFLKTISDICNVIRRSDSVEDVTLTYVDLESHRDALKTEQSRLLELLEQAESMEDILVIEERLTNIRYQLESMESSLRTIDNQVNFSTIYLSVSEVKELTPVEEKTTGQRIAEGFVESLKDVGNGAVEVFVWVVVNLPHLVVWAAVIALIVLLFRKCRRKKKAQKEAAKNEAIQRAEDKSVQEKTGK